MLDPTHPISGFFDDDPERVLASLPAIERSSGRVKDLDTLYRKVGERDLRGHRDGLFDARIFATPDGFGHVETAGVLHPSVYPRLVDVLQIDTPFIRAIARGENLLRGETVIEDVLAREDDDLGGPRGIAEAVRRRRPDHPLLPLLTIKKIPVPPLAARPLRPSELAEAIDAWIGPVNEAWLEVIRLAHQDTSLQELDAPPIVSVDAACRLQRAVDEVYTRTRRAEAHLFPPMERGIDESVLAIAFAGPERIVIQRGTGVRTVDISGREIHRAPPCGCVLRGVIDGHLAVFHDFQRDIHPLFSDEGMWPRAFVERGIDHIFSPVSVLDVDTGRYLDRAPANIPRTFVENDEPEDLFLGGRRLDEVGGDRPAVSAYTNDLRFAQISGDSTQIISLESGTTVVRPATTSPDEIAESLDLTTGAIVEHDWDDQGGGSGSAIAFAGGRWFTFDCNGALSDHIGNEAIVITPMATAAAFDPAGDRLALVVDNELVIIDRATRALRARFPA